MLLERILYIASEISPFLQNSLVAECVRKLPEVMQHKQLDIRLMVPKFGTISDRMNRLHEVSRLSNHSIKIRNIDHAISVKVSTVPNTRLQVYFIDNIDLFGGRKGMFKDNNDHFFMDNDLRMVFFCTSVIHTLKKLEWAPDVVHCHDWITGLIPLLWKKLAAQNSLFSTARLMSTLYNNTFPCTFPLLEQTAIQVGIAPEDASILKSGNFRSIIQLMLNHSDFVTAGEKLVADEFKDLGKTHEFPLVQDDEGYGDTYFDIYQKLINMPSVLYKTN